VTNLSDAGAGSLRAALAAADVLPGKDTIAFHLPTAPAGSENTIVLTSGSLTCAGNVTIAGPGAGKLIINGGGSQRVFDFGDGNPGTDSPVAVSGLSVVGGNAAGAKGGGIYSTESLTLSHVVISGCTAVAGGGVFVEGTQGAGVASISNSLVTGNSAAGSGGGVQLDQIRSIAVKTCTVSGNSAGTVGGGMRLTLNAAGTGTTVSGCTVTRNGAGIGGGIAATDGSVLPTAKTLITGCTVSENNSYSDSGGGGGLFLGLGTVAVSGTRVIGNSAVYYGGGIDAGYFTSLTVSKCTISGNRAAKPTASDQGGGGGVFIEGAGTGALAPATVTGCTIEENSGNRGGGLLAQNGIKLAVSRSTLASDQAAFGGGLMTQGTGADQVAVTVAGTTFADCTGSGAHFSGSGAVVVANSKVTGCFAAEGAGIAVYGDGPSTFALKDTVITGNTAQSTGGGLLVTQTGQFSVIGGSISGNAAAFEGGGAYFVGSVGAVIGTTITGNVSGFAGGGAYDAGPRGVTIQVAKVRGNTAPSHADTGGEFMFV
jgi:hypothetical protein